MCTSRIAEQQPAHQRERRAVELSAREAERHQAAGPPPDGRKNRPGAQHAGASEHRRDCHAVTTAATIEILPLATASRSPPLTSRLLGSGGAPCRTGERRGHPMTALNRSRPRQPTPSAAGRERDSLLPTVSSRPRARRRPLRPCSSSSSVVADGPLALSGLLDDPGEPYRPVQGLLYGQVDVPHGRLGSLVQVAVHANRAWRDLT